MLLSVGLGGYFGLRLCREFVERHFVGRERWKRLWRLWVLTAVSAINGLIFAPHWVAFPISHVLERSLVWALGAHRVWIHLFVMTLICALWWSIVAIAPFVLLRYVAKRTQTVKQW